MKAGARGAMNGYEVWIENASVSPAILIVVEPRLLVHDLTVEAVAACLCGRPNPAPRRQS
jgi:hypothetical protein